jgi:hypothetical protein
VNTTADVNGYKQFVALYRCEVVTSLPFVCKCGDVKVELFRERRRYAPSKYHNLVVAAVKEAEYCSPAPPPLALDTRNQHLILTWRTRLERGAAQARAEHSIDKVVATLSAIISPDLFRTLLFRGWLQGPSERDLGILCKVVAPIEVSGKDIARDFGAATAALARNPALRERFALMSRFVAKGLAEAPDEEAFVWLWTALEVFPMIDTTDIRPIAEFLGPYIGESAAVAKEKIKVGWLFGMRSRLVHDGRLPLEMEAKFSALANLERLVHAVLRHAAGLPYNGAFHSESSVT